MSDSVMFDIIQLDELDEMLNYLEHYGTKRHSGRYPWGSGENPYQRTKDFVGHVRDLKSQGMTEKEIAEGMEMTTTQLRARYSIAKDEVKKEEYRQIMKLKEKGWSNAAIAKELGLPSESSVRSRMDEGQRNTRNITQQTADYLQNEVDKKTYVDVGPGTENYLGISTTKLKTSLEVLKDKGYNVYYIKEEQVGTGEKTTITVVCPPDVTYAQAYKERANIKLIGGYSEDHGETIRPIEAPRPVAHERVGIVYAEDGGTHMDGTMLLRRGVPELSLKDAHYAQVRISVDGTHYLKGMAMYGDDEDFPPVKDIIFYTNKHKDVPMMGTKDNSVLKPIKKDPSNPFGATIRNDDELIRAQRHYIDENGKEQLSCLNIVNEEGNWGDWKKSLSSQMLSKQPIALAKRQLDKAYASKEEEFNDILSLTNPVIKQKLLESFADSCDSDSVHLKAAGLPRQGSHVILPFDSVKDNEIYAPNYDDGERVVLIRYPHAGRFEIPELIVNNKNPDCIRAIGRPRDAVGINYKVAERLSGADFDGDTVLVIPNNSGAIKTKSPLEGLKDFDPKERYPGYEGMPAMTPRMKQQQMGDISNLITDMTIKGATDDELARAVRHSMVVIDAEKHVLNYKQSYKDNRIRELKAKYQGVNERGQVKGASTLISRASSEYRVDDREDGKYMLDPKTGKEKRYYFDPNTGEKLYTYTGETYMKKKVNKKGEVSYKEVKRQIKSTKMAEVKDARELSSGTRMEEVYLNHANKLKALGNKARLATMTIKPIPYSPSAKQVYAKEVASLNAKLNIALMNAPHERQAQLLANKIIKETMADNPGMDKDDIKKLKGRALNTARLRVGAAKKQIDITDREWEAIQSGAISTSKLKLIIANTDEDKLKQRAMPRDNKPLMSDGNVSRARAMLARGYTQAEVAKQLGVSVSTMMKAIEGEK